MTWDELFTSDSYLGCPAGIAWSPDGKHIVTTAWSGSYEADTVEVWDTSSKQCIFTCRIDNLPVFEGAWSFDGMHVVSAHYGHRAQVWNITTEPIIHTCDGLAGRWSWSKTVKWSPDGKHIASVSEDHAVQIWDATTGISVFVFHGHTDKVHAIAWSPDGKRVASVSSDHTIQVWDAVTDGSGFAYCTHSGEMILNY